MINNTQILLIIISIFLFTSCEEVIDVELESSTLALVAEGNIEPGKRAWLQLSYSSDYFSEEETEYEEEATVFLADNRGNFDTLFYDRDGIYRGRDIVGRVNTTYTISVYRNNNRYQASSVLLPASNIMDAWFEKSGMKRPGEDEGKKRIHVGITNDTQQDNYYLFKFYINGEPEGDKYSITNSKYYPDEEFLDYNPIRIDFESGDNVEIIAYRIDEDTYNYFNQLNDILESRMGGSSTPYNPQSNFGENVMGFFMAWSHNSFKTTVP